MSLVGFSLETGRKGQKVSTIREERTAEVGDHTGIPWRD